MSYTKLERKSRMQSLAHGLLFIRRWFWCLIALSISDKTCALNVNCGTLVQSGMTSGNKAYIVSRHNDFRKEAAKGALGYTASDMKEMVWDDELQTIAQKCAESCARSASCDALRATSRRYGNPGQNVYYSGYSPDNRERAGDWSDPFKYWGKLKQAPPTINSYQHSSEWGSYTQLIWAESNRVGCGYAKFLKGSQGDYLYVCFYGPAGNVRSRPMFSIGKPCTRCPSEYKLCLDGALCHKGEPPTTTTTLRPKTTPKVRKPCYGRCVPTKSIDYFCHPYGVQYGTDDCHRSEEACCRSLKPSTTSTSTTTQRPTTRKTTAVTTPPRPKSCKNDCIRHDLDFYCEPRTIDWGRTTCASGELCCKIRPRTTPATTTTTTSTTPRPRKCLNQCVASASSHVFCQPGTLDFGHTTCYRAEVCCQVQKPTTPRTTTKTTKKPSCSAPFVCVNEHEASNQCVSPEEQRYLMLFNIGKALGSCPTGKICCAPKKIIPCPSTHVCLPRSQAALCQPGTTVETDVDCKSEFKVCCKLLENAVPAVSNEFPSSRGTVSGSHGGCKGACLTGIDEEACVVAGLALPGVQCPNGGSCCSLGEDEADDSGEDLSTRRGCPRLSGLSNGHIRIVSCENVLDNLIALAIRNRTDCFKNGAYPIGTRISYECDEYYDLLGESYRACGQAGRWNGDQPNCKAACGQRHFRVSLASRGKVSQPGEWPWQVAVYSKPDKIIICGGALIKTNWVMTAAHCVFNTYKKLMRASEFTVYLGKMSRSNEKDDDYVQQKKVSRVIPHPSYSARAGTYDSDIVLLRLTTPATLNRRVQLVCLPESFPLSEENLRGGNLGVVAGFGANEHGRYSPDLTHVKFPVIPTKKCREDTIKVSGGDSAALRLLNNNMFCAGHGLETSLEEYQSVCIGDSGSPMVFQSTQDGRWYAEGIVSFYTGNISCQARKPGMYSVFTKVHNFVPWIRFAAV